MPQMYPLNWIILFILFIIIFLFLNIMNYFNFKNKINYFDSNLKINKNFYCLNWKW